jgi:hypothetical protein
MRLHAAPHPTEAEAARNDGAAERDGYERRAGIRAHYAPPEAAIRCDRDAWAETRRQFTVWG